jgi:hypothetical protein
VVAVPTPLANVTLMVLLREPVPPSVEAKKSVVLGELKVSVVVPLLVVVLPKASSICRLKVTLVVLDAVAEVGLGVMATVEAGPTVIERFDEDPVVNPLRAALKE